MLSGDYIRRLEGDRECLEALAWLADRGFKYKRGGFTPPLARRERDTEPTTFSALLLTDHRLVSTSPRRTVTTVAFSDGGDEQSVSGSPSDIAGWLASHVFVRGRTGSLIVTEGKARQSLDVFLDSIGPELLQLGYTLQPMQSAGSVSWLIVRKARRKWTITCFETMTGCPVSVGLGLAQDATESVAESPFSARSIFTATTAVQKAYLSVFGVALCPTVGMTALASARESLPTEFQKWRPAPLLVAMEREGKGYRGGLTFARRYRGHTTRVDVTRQYTWTLAHDLPHEWVFGRFPGHHSLAPGLYMCRVWLAGGLPYPIGVWDGGTRGFVMETVARGEYVCVLHTPEIRAITAAGGRVWPEYGYTATSTFSFGSYVSKIQDILTKHGRDSAIAQLVKPLGNTVYGKLGQRPEFDEMLFSVDDPGPEYDPYFDIDGVAWEMVWTRRTIRHTASQHPDVAGYITSLARQQTIEMWLRLRDAGREIVRCHTDSLTFSGTLPPEIRTERDVIGAWRVENESQDGMVTGANAYADDDSAHIAGVSTPRRGDIERLYVGDMVRIEQNRKTPRRGFERGEETVTRELRATAGDRP